MLCIRFLFLVGAMVQWCIGAMVHISGEFLGHGPNPFNPKSSFGGPAYSGGPHGSGHMAKPIPSPLPNPKASFGGVHRSCGGHSEIAQDDRV